MYRAVSITILIFVAASVAIAEPPGRLIAPGDKVRVSVLNEADLTKDAVLGKDGKMTLSILGEITLAGMSPVEAALKLENQLKEFIRNPKVNIEILESAKMKVFIVGEVTKPGMIEVESGARLMEAVAPASYTPNADLTKITINRANTLINIDLTQFLTGKDLSKNIELFDKDSIVIGRVQPIETVNVFGEANRPGTIEYKPGMSLNEIITAAGGVTPNADTKGVILRRENDLQAVLIDLSKPKEPNISDAPVIMAGDTITIPRTQERFIVVQGAVNQPGRYALREGMTIEDATAQAGGLARDAKIDAVQVIHNNCGVMKTETVNLRATREGRSPALVLCADDIVVIPAKRENNLLQVIMGLASFGWLIAR